MGGMFGAGFASPGDRVSEFALQVLQNIISRKKVHQGKGWGYSQFSSCIVMRYQNLKEEIPKTLTLLRFKELH